MFPALVAFNCTFRGPMYDRRPGFFREDTSPVPGRRVDATVKWFNASKGFGFVTLSDGTQDAFLPMAILRRAGYDDVREGASIACEVSEGAKGPLVTNVLNIDSSTAVAPRGDPRGDGIDHRPPGPGQRVRVDVVDGKKGLEADRITLIS